MIPLLHLRDISVALDDRIVLDHVSLEVAPGEVVRVSGPSGCGKSTLLAVAGGQIPHSRNATLWGSVWLDGEDVTQLPPAQRARSLGFLAQDPASSLCLTRADDEVALALENRCVPDGAITTELVEHARRAGVAHLLARDTAALSGGQQQRLALAAVLALQPRVLLLDEPLSLLDPAAAEEVARTLADVARAGVAVVVVEHRVDELLAAGLVVDRTVTLGRPRTVALLHRHSSSPGEQPQAVRLGPLRATADGPVIQEQVEVPVAPRTVVALLGPNGSGKSTTLRALAGLLPHVTSPVAAECGLVFQRPEKQFIATTVAAELGFGTRPEDVAALCRLVHLDIDPAASPWQLSVGEQRRLSLVAVAAQGHPVLLLDEPTFGLDEAAARGVEQTICDLAGQGRCVVVSTHAEDMVGRIADRVVRLPPGPDDSSGGDPDAAPARTARGARRASNGSPLGRCSPVAVFLTGLFLGLALLTTTRIAPALAAWAAITALTPVLARVPLAAVLKGQAPVAGFAVGVFVVNLASRPWPQGLFLGLGLGARTLCLAAIAVAFSKGTDPVRFVDSLHQQVHLPSRHAYSALAGARLMQGLPAQWKDLRDAHRIRARGLVDASTRGRWQSVALFARSGFSLLVDALRQGQRLAEALDARGLGMLPRRTHRRPLAWHRRDLGLAAAAFMLIALAGVVQHMVAW